MRKRQRRNDAAQYATYTVAAGQSPPLSLVILRLDPANQRHRLAADNINEYAVACSDPAALWALKIDVVSRRNDHFWRLELYLATTEAKAFAPRDGGADCCWL